LKTGDKPWKSANKRRVINNSGTITGGSKLFLSTEGREGELMVQGGSERAWQAHPRNSWCGKDIGGERNKEKKKAGRGGMTGPENAGNMGGGD